MNIMAIARKKTSASILRVIENGVPLRTDWAKRGKRWASTPSGKASMRERGKRYRATEKGKANARKKNLAYYARHKDDPAFKAKKKAHEQAFRERRKARKMTGEYTFILIGQTITTALYAV